ncbi:hypothetical protein Atc_1270 [Acidithiobacillus caldus SM-1]|uniref:Uncharacterized protein n=1 Tax=Acidithiobacillus caldus (strain SM-1) TaxID=990288 RepID=F9ZNT9_ACICS|nr:hypothetical protein [Acidithiobacillus caldus]AEK57919.1 hypothetical protein Atc_1270 [Acidithiobacillus caldus SM-1]
MDLFRRSPALALSVYGVFLLFNGFISQPLYLNVPVTVFLMGLLFSSLRAADHDSGNAWSPTFHFLKIAASDLVLLARDAFLFFFASGVLIDLLFLLLAGIQQEAHAATGMNPGFLHLPYFLRIGVTNGYGNDVLGLFLPGALPTVFLTMSVGNQLLLHFHTGFKAFSMNATIAVVNLALMGFCYLVEDTIMGVGDYWLLAAIAYCLSGIVFWWFGAWGYLWCREMFEGISENAEATQKRVVEIFSAA